MHIYRFPTKQMYSMPCGSPNLREFAFQSTVLSISKCRSALMHPTALYSLIYCQILFQVLKTINF
jgi:hypothetical protein